MPILARRSAPPALLLVLAAVSASGRAASAEPVPIMTLDEALTYAAQHQPQIRAALAEWSARRSEARIPRALWLPQVGATAQLFAATANNTTSSYLNVPEVDVPRIGGAPANAGTSWAPYASSIGAVSVDQELYDFGRISAQIAAGDALAAVARAGADAMLLDVQLGVDEAYHAVVAAKDVLGATDEALRRAVTHRDYAAAGTKTGMRPPIDLTRAQADVSLLEVRRIRAVSGLESARAAFAASMGSTALSVDAAPPPAGEEPPSPALDEAIERAARKNPAIAAALSQLAAQRAQTKAIGRELLPNVFASVGISGRAGGAATATAAAPFGDGFLPDVPNWHAGVIIQWNLFDATVLARRSASKAREEAAQANVEVARTAVALGAERAYLDLDAALKALPGLALAVDAAQKNQLQADARFRAGLGTIVELADAEALLTAAQLELAIGRFTVARARASLGRVMAERLSPPRAPGKE